MRKLILLAALSSALLITLTPFAFAAPVIAVDTNPGLLGIQTFREIYVGETATMDVVVLGLPSSEPLAAFQFDIAFDPLILRPLNVISYNSLPAPTLSSSSLAPEVSFVETSLSPFGPFPFGNLRLASVTFQGIGNGLSTLDLNDTVLSDEFGFAIVHDTADASLKVPEPSSTILISLGLVILGMVGRCTSEF